MRHIYLFVLCLFTFGVLSAQEEQLSKEEKQRREKNIQAGNPFAKFGYKAKVATLSKGKYLEVHDLDSIVTIGTIRYNVNQNKIVGNIVQDTTDMYAQPIGDIAGRWLSPDPLSDEFPEWSPYTSMNDNPIKFNDPTGLAAMAPIYGTDGSFLGTDDEGLQGKGIVMKEGDFKQGMSHEKALSKSLGAEGLESNSAVNKVVEHYNGLKDRPDYDGVVTPREGRAWAKSHPNLRANSQDDEFTLASTDDKLYLDASKMDFGALYQNEFKEVGVSQNVNLFRPSNVATFNSSTRATTYALGRTKMTLLNRYTGQVRVDNGSWNAYDWNTGGGMVRDKMIRADRRINGLNNSHGVPVSIYGTGTLNVPPITTCFVAGTKVLMANGSYKNIEDVTESDKIMSVNMKTMNLEEDLVLELPTKIKKYQIIRMSLNDKTIIEFSPAHPFWIVNKGWSVYNKKEAKKELTFKVNQIKKGDKVLKYFNGNLIEVIIEDIVETNKKIEMYNVEHVAKNNNFFANKILVHNKRENK